MMSVQIKLRTTIALILVITCLSQHINAEDNTTTTIKCIECDSSNPDCLNDLSKFEPKACTTGNCYTKSDAGKIYRGCLAADTKCEITGCYQCSTDGCNKHLICKNCSSSTDPDCSQTDANKDTYNSVCSKQETSCISLVRDDKHVERRCAKEGEKCENTNTCSTCTSGNCNVGIFPSKRIRCYQCPLTESKCGDVSANSESIKSKPCLLYSADDKCYTFGTSTTTMLRGCVSDPDTNLNKCSQPDSTEACGACNTDNCNNRAYQRDQKLKCVQCNSATDKECQFDQKSDKATNCKDKILYSQNDSCYFETRPDKTVRRGCLYERPKEDGACTAPDCTTCESGDGCNSQANTTFTCIRCRSDLNTKCRNDAKSISGDTCRNQNMTDTNKDCFVGKWHGVVIRGCLVDADERQQVLCADKNNSQCTTCNGKDCNTKKSGAASIKIASSLLALIALLIWRLH